MNENYELKLSLTDEVLSALRDIAEQKNLSVAQLAEQVLIDYVEEPGL